MLPLDLAMIDNFSKGSGRFSAYADPVIEDIFIKLWWKYSISIFYLNRSEMSIQFIDKATRIVKSFEYDPEVTLMEQSDRVKKLLLSLKLKFYAWNKI